MLLNWLTKDKVEIGIHVTLESQDESELTIFIVGWKQFENEWENLRVYKAGVSESTSQRFAVSLVA